MHLFRSTAVTILIYFPNTCYHLIFSVEYLSTISSEMNSTHPFYLFWYPKLHMSNFLFIGGSQKSKNIFNNISKLFQLGFVERIFWLKQSIKNIFELCVPKVLWEFLEKKIIVVSATKNWEKSRNFRYMLPEDLLSKWQPYRVKYIYIFSYIFLIIFIKPWIYLKMLRPTLQNSNAKNLMHNFS